jgi:hypothetical protein
MRLGTREDVANLHMLPGVSVVVVVVSVMVEGEQQGDKPCVHML